MEESGSEWHLGRSGHELDEVHRIQMGNADGISLRKVRRVNRVHERVDAKHDCRFLSVAIAVLDSSSSLGKVSVCMRKGASGPIALIASRLA